jgi:phage terminase large subunit-like protein
MAVRLAQNYEDTIQDEPFPPGYRNPPHLILIEAKVSGYSLYADLYEAGLPVVKFNPNNYGDKFLRCQMISHLIENGLVWLQTIRPEGIFLNYESQLLLENAASFSEDNPNDIVDSMTQAFIRLKESNRLSNRFDPSFNPQPMETINYTQLTRKEMMLR